MIVPMHWFVLQFNSCELTILSDVKSLGLARNVFHQPFGWVDKLFVYLLTISSFEASVDFFLCA